MQKRSSPSTHDQRSDVTYHSNHTARTSNDTGFVSEGRRSRYADGPARHGGLPSLSPQKYSKQLPSSRPVADDSASNFLRLQAHSDDRMLQLSDNFTSHICKFETAVSNSLSFFSFAALDSLKLAEIIHLSELVSFESCHWDCFTKLKVVWLTLSAYDKTAQLSTVPDAALRQNMERAYQRVKDRRHKLEALRSGLSCDDVSDVTSLASDLTVSYETNGKLPQFSATFWGRVPDIKCWVWNIC